MATPTTFPNPLCFRCLESCGLCCAYRVVVLAGETAFLKKHGHHLLPAAKESKTERQCVAGYLPHRDGYCVFLNDRKQCSIYEHRPLYCRLFPLIRDSYPQRQIDVNLSCPGLGHGTQFLKEDFDRVAKEEEAAADLPAWEEHHQRAFRFAKERLTRRGAYAPQSALAAAACSLARDALLSGAALDVGERLHRVTEASRPALLSCGNVHEAGKLINLFGGVVHGPDKALPSGPSTAFFNYLVLWTRRNLMLRAAHACALASPLPTNVACHFMQLMGKVASEICDIGSRLPESGRIEGAIRQLDGSLRSQFMRVSLTWPS